MKKMRLLTLAVMAVFAANAQDTSMNNTTRIGSAMQQTPQLRTPMAVKTRFGLKAGVNLARLSAKEFTATAEPHTNTKTSFNAGAFVNIPLGGMFRIQPELVFSSQGSKVEEMIAASAGTRQYNYEYDLHYVNLPVMFQLQTQKGFFVETGPQFSYLIDAKSKGATPLSTEDETDYDYYFDNFDIAWGVGVGYLSRIGLGVNARYNYGIRNIVNENDVDLGEMRNRVLQFGLVYHFGAYK